MPVPNATRVVGLLCLALFPLSALAERIVLSEIHYNPKDGRPEYIELFNNSGSAVDFATWKFTNGVDYTFPDFSAGDPQRTFMCAFERVLVTNVDEGAFRAAYTVPPDVKIFGPYAGSLNNAGETIELRDKNGVLACRLRYNDRGNWPVAADGAGHSLRLVSNYGSCSDYRNWTVSAAPGGTPGSAPAGEEGQSFPDPSVDLSGAFPLVELGSVWKFDDSGADLGTAWRQPDFNDGGWASGPGVFGRESKAMPGPGLQTPLATGVVTFYFRKQFEWQGGTDSGFFSMDAVLDDGLAVYLNGVELGRHRLPAGDLNFQTRATSVPSNLEAVVEERIVEADISGLLQQGTNTIAIELHNNSAASSDVVLGPAVRISGSGGSLVINEVKPGAAGEGFIEFYNSSTAPIDLAGYHLSDDETDLAKFTLGAMVVPAGGFATVGFTESGFGVGAQTTIYLSTPGAVTVLDGFDAPLAADGRSVGRKPAGGSDWFVFTDSTPGEANIDSGDLSGLMALSEVHFAADGSVDWVELYADSNSAVPVDGLALASSRDFADAVPLSGSLGAGESKSWAVAFPQDDNGEVRVHLITGGGTVLAADVFRARAGVESYQSDPPGKEWFRGPGQTKDAPNAPVRNEDIVINEIMCDPPSDERNGEFVELYNRGDAPVDISGWEFTDAINFVFPSGTTIPAGGYLVVAANKDWMASTYPGITVVGNYDNNLANEGELLRLEDAAGNLADEVDYAVGGDWPQLGNGDGSSLELVHPDADNALPTSWRDSDEADKSQFESYSYTGVYSHLSVPRLDKELWVHLVGDAHVIIKNLKLLRNGTDILQNADQRTTNGSSTTGWLPQGTHHASFFDAEGFHLISDGHGDNRANKAELQVNAMDRNDELTLQFDARWVMGKPRIVFKTFEDSFVSTFGLPIPNALGTPGAANSTSLPAAPPALDDLAHRPAVPSSSDNVTVSARVGGEPTSVSLVYRRDTRANDEPWKTVVMNDSGAGADQRAGDGIWAAQIADQKVDGRVVQFYVEATGSGQTVTLPSRAPGIPAMYVVDDAEVVTDVTSYRWVVSEYDKGAWQSGSNSNAAYDWKFPNLSNSYKKMTLIVDEQEVFYNCEIRPSGSPWHAGDRSNLNKRGKWKLPKDKRLRGLSKLSWDNTPAAEGAANIFNNKVPRYILYLMGHEVNENEFCTVIENATNPRHSVELFEPIGNDFLERNFGDDGPQGELYRPDDVFFFDDNYGKDQITNRYWWYAGDQWPGPGRYHSQWLLRSREADYDYTALINLLKTARNSNSYTEDEINRLVDARRIGMMAAMRGYIGDWDSFTLRRPKNTFFYRPPGDGKFHFFFHDSDLAYQNTGEIIYQGGAELGAWLRKPYNRRIFRYYMAEILDKFQANGPRVDAWFDCEQSVSNTYNPNQGKYTSWDSGRRSRIQSELGANYNLAFDVDPVGSTTDDVISITGDAGYRVWEVEVVGHPEAIFSWVDETKWRIDGIALKSGANSLQVVALDDDGVPAFGEPSEAISVNKTNDAAPYLKLEFEPKSANVALSEPLELDATGSYDPEGGALTFSWAAAPSASAEIADFGATATALFSAAGLYAVSVEASDPGAGSSSSNREIAVYAPNGFSNFNGVWIDPWIREQDVKNRDNSSAGSWWSLIEEPGKLAIHIPDDKPYPLGLPPGQMETANYVALGAQWKYNDTNTDYMATFADPDFDDGAWPAGGGMFGVETGTIPAPGINTPLNRDSAAGLVTYYFRTEFEFGADPVGAIIDLNAVLDDGARFWLNGQELQRVRLPAGVITHTTSASSNTPSSDEKQIRPVGSGSFDGTGVLVNGTNALAVDLHNGSAFSSDILFAAELDITAQPLVDGGSLDGTTHPWLKRDLPGTTDWALQTDLELVTLQFGEFMTGLMIELEVDGKRTRYAFGYRNGTELAVAQVTSNGSAGTAFSTPFSDSDDVILRIRREGDSLFFDRAIEPGFWTNLHSLSPGAGWTALEGGIFASTDAANSLRTSFDYLMLVDPNSTSPAAGDIVISEVMYKPNGGSQHEFIEIYNAGDQSIDLTGYSFPQDRPVDEFVFPARTIAPGEYLLAVADQAAFLAEYGAGLAPQVVGAWGGGNLNNSGDEIVLLDADGLVVASFVYSDSDPWPTSPDTDGTSLTLADPATGSTSNPANWVASVAAGGTPGGPRSPVGPLPVLDISRNGDSIVLSWQNGILESSPDLEGAWQPVDGAQSPLSLAIQAGGHLFFRVRGE